jgi:hypothetical protein
MRNCFETPNSVHNSPIIVDTIKKTKPIIPEMIKIKRVKNIKIIIDIFE